MTTSRYATVSTVQAFLAPTRQAAFNVRLTVLAVLGVQQDPRHSAQDSSMSANSKLARPVPFTPRRNPGLSVATGADDDHTRLPRSTTPSLLGSSKKYKAPLSSESRTRHNGKSGLGSVPPTPSRSMSRDGSRPKTPVSPRKGSESPFLMANMSEMDVSNVDPEEVLVDFENVEADVSVEIDEAMLRSEYGKEDRVLVSIR